MALRINNSYFMVSNSSFRSIEPLVIPPVGQIFRVVNTGTLTDSLSYTKIDGSIASTGTITASGIKYVLALSGSLTDSTGVGGLNQLTVTNLLITSTVDENPTFTEQLLTTGFTWTKPDGVTDVIVELWGGGGAGGGVSTNNNGGAGGGGGAYARKYIKYASASQNIGYTVGSGGVGSTGAGGNGSASSWEISVLAYAQPGFGGGANLAGSGGTPGLASACVGDILYDGGTSTAGVYVPAGFNPEQLYAGAGGGGAGSVGPGNGAFYSPYGLGDASMHGGIAKVEYGGNGGEILGYVPSNNTGVAGSNYGSGGSGAMKISGPARAGGNGTQGLIRIIYR